jgi:hypothetical protein
MLETKKICSLKEVDFSKKHGRRTQRREFFYFRFLSQMIIFIWKYGDQSDFCEKIKYGAVTIDI